jgi:hypothetical protein
MSDRIEMTLDELLADPLIRMLMASDRADVHALRQTAREVRIRMISHGQEGREPERLPCRRGEVPLGTRSNRGARSLERIQLAG